VVPFPLFCRTIRASSSGSHRGQGHAAVNVERKRNIMEYSWRFREVRIVEIRVWTPLQWWSFQPIRQKSSQYPKICICTCADSSGKLSRRLFRNNWFRGEGRFENEVLARRRCPCPKSEPHRPDNATDQPCKFSTESCFPLNPKSKKWPNE
jgi:hypothetical protein